MAGMAKNGIACRDLVIKPKEKWLLGIPDTDGSVILNCTKNK
jgi:hypothetical protein